MDNSSSKHHVIRHPAYDTPQPLFGARPEQPAGALRHQLNAALHHSRAAGHETALLVLQIGEFWELSETLGESFARQLSGGVESRLNDCLSHTDLVRKLADDEFAIVLASLKNVEDIGRTAQCLIDTCSGCYGLGALDPIINISAGIALFPSDADQSEELLHSARIALRRSDATHKSYQFFCGELPGREKNNYWMGAQMARYA